MNINGCPSLSSLFRALFAVLLLSVGVQVAHAERKTTYYHTDALGSVVAASNDAGSLLWRKEYAPFGEQLDSTTEQEKLAYTGKEHDDATGLTYFGARYYDPHLGRFMGVDPVGFIDSNPMSFNRYAYVNNNPYKYVDPDGEFLNFAAKFVLDVGINVAFNYVTTGQLDVGGALKESAVGILNPAKTVAKAGKLGMALAKATKRADKIDSPCKLSCFVAGTAVLSEHGFVAIETLQEGDLVWAHDPDSDTTRLKPIVRTFVNTKDSVWELTLEMNGARYRHEVTGSHPYFVIEEGWVEVANLRVGALLKTAGEQTAVVTGVHDTGQVLTTYNFEVADIHTYYVSSAKVLVHNCNGFVDLASQQRRTHILDGDATGGGHRPGTGKPGKSEFPQGWSDDKIMHEISDVATDPNAARSASRGGRTVVTGTRDGIDIKVVLGRDGNIVTGYPTNVPRNP